jgi:hypothetical protein
MLICGMRILGSDVVREARSQRAGGNGLSVFAGGDLSLAGSAIFKSHLHNGQRVANEYTTRPKATHSVFVQALISASGHRENGAKRSAPLTLRLENQNSTRLRRERTCFPLPRIDFSSKVPARPWGQYPTPIRDVKRTAVEDVRWEAMGGSAG